MNQSKIWDILYSSEPDKWKLESKLPLITKGQRVLEVGAGNGKTLSAILSQKPKSVVAIDFSKKAVEILKKNFKDNNLEIRSADVRFLPFKENEFDIIICSFVLNNLVQEDRIQAVNELYRVLKEKGHLIFSDFAQGDYRYREGEKLEYNTVKKNNGLVFHVFTKDEIKSLFSKFKIKNIKISISNPIRSSPNLKRKRISFMATKR